MAGPARSWPCAAWSARSPARRGAGEGGGRLTKIQRHRPLPGKVGLGPDSPAIHPGDGCLRPGRPGGRRRGVVVGQAGGRHHQDRARRYRPVRARRCGVRFRCSGRFRRRRSHCFPATFQASHLALFRRGRLQAGETLVVHSAASGLGTAGIQLGKAADARVIAVAGGAEKGALCTSLESPGHRPHRRGLCRRGAGCHR